jgi:hypothetical protein
MPRLSVRLDVLLDRIGLCMSRGHRIDGLWVGCLTSDKEKRLMAFDPVEEALGLIKRHDPLRYDRLRRDLVRIWVFLLAGNWGEYRHPLRMCVLDERVVLDEATRSEQIASTIVHEATHARLMRRGIGYEGALRAHRSSLLPPTARLRRQAAAGRGGPGGRSTAPDRLPGRVLERRILPRTTRPRRCGSLSLLRHVRDVHSECISLGGAGAARR